uniref:Protein SET n=1 Tax=Aegilops tauschii TaxID=37682 RepID=M8BX82_AEGTA
MTAPADKGKKAKTDTDVGEENEQIDGALVLSIERLQEIQDELEKCWGGCTAGFLSGLIGAGDCVKFRRTDECILSPDSRVNEEASDKVLEVEQKYSEIRRPVYLRRCDIIKTIPDFWLTAFLSHPLLSELLTEEDQKMFKYLESVDVDDSKDVKSGYSITLNFSENPYFEDRKLTKSYAFADDGTTTINATSIKWKEGMEINGNAIKKKGSKRPLVEERWMVKLKYLVLFIDTIL